MAVKQLKQILRDYLKGDDFEEINNTISIQTAWKKTVGNPIIENTKIESFKNGTIKIKVSNAIWRNELSLQKQDILDKLIKTEPNLNIKKIILK